LLPGPKPDPTRPRSRYGTQREGSPNRISRRQFATETRCANNHLFTNESTYWRKDPNDGVERRICRICLRAAQRKSKGLPAIPDDTPFGPRNKDKTHCPQNHEYTPENTYTYKSGLRRCRKCMRAQQIRHDYGIEPEQFDFFIEKQGNACAICERSFEVETPHVDHDHADGHVRGILCRPCNSGLGFFEDSLTMLRRAVRYLDRISA
jgi:hypothetical protein